MPVMTVAPSRRHLSLIAAALLALLTLPCLTFADDPPFTPNDSPTLDVQRATGPIKIDGELDEPAWQTAARATNFAEFAPGDNSRPPVETEARITYDTSNLYLAFIATDTPDAIRARLRDRDQIFDDDYIGLMLDTYGDASWSYELFFNPLGIQGDLLMSSNGNEEILFDIVHTSKGRLTATGYQVEVAVPFSSLRFPKGANQTWRADFWRDRRRSQRNQYSWSKISRDAPCFMCQWGTLTGITDVHPATGVDILPYVTESQVATLRNPDDLTSGLDAQSVHTEVGGTVRYALGTGMTTEATVNPDFSQVESDAAQIDVNTTFALFYPEKRPFFQEGSDLWSTWIDAVYTRSINDPSVAARFTGRNGRTSVAYVAARDVNSPIIVPFEERSAFLLGPASWSNLLRVKRTFWEDSFLGGLVTDRRFSGDAGGSGTVYGLDTSVRRGHYRFEGQVLGSHTDEGTDAVLSAPAVARQSTFDDSTHTTAFDGESFDGFATYLSLERDARTWNFDFDYWAWSPTFRADNGFVTQNDKQQALFWNGLTFRRAKGFVTNFQPSVQVARVWNSDGIGKDRWIRPQVFVQLPRTTGVSIAALWSHERFQEQEFPGIRRFSVNVNTRLTKTIGMGTYVETGRFIARFLGPNAVLGRGTTVSVWGTLTPIQRLVIEPTLDYARLEHPDTGEEFYDSYIARARTQYQFTRELFLRLVTQYNGFAHVVDVDPLLSYKLNPFSVAYLGSTHEMTDTGDPTGYRSTNRQIFAKVQYLLRR